MNYRVVFRRRFSDNLHMAQFYTHETGRDPDAVSRAAAEISARLGDDPAGEGESREGSERVLIVHPLTVTYEVFENAGVVLVYGGVHYPSLRL